MRTWAVILLILVGIAQAQETNQPQFPGFAWTTFVQAQGVAILELTQFSFGTAIKTTVAYDLKLGPFIVSPYLQFGSGPPQWFGQVGIDLIGNEYSMGVALHSQWGWLYRLRWIGRF